MTGSKHLLPLRWRAYARHPKVRGAFISAFWSAVVFYFVFTSLILVTRWYLLPQVNRFKEPIAQAVGEIVGCEVSIGSIEPHWDTFWPRLSLRDVSFVVEPAAAGGAAASDIPSQTVLTLPEVEASLYWRTLLGSPRFKDLTIANASLSVRRLSQYVYDIAGFEIDLTPEEDKEKTGGALASGARASGLISWLLKQGRLSIIDSTVVYEDLTDPESQPTAFEKIDFTFENQPVNYALGLQAELVGRGRNTIDLRAAFTTSLFDEANWRQWEGSIYLAASGLDIARLVKPSDVLSPVIVRGRGDLRAWIDFAEARPVSITSDVALRRLKLALPGAREPLELRRLSARITESLQNEELRVEAQGLSYELADGSTGLTPRIGAQILLAPGRLDTRTAYLRFAEIDLASIRKLLPALPLPESVANLIAERAPSGKLHEAALNWRGPARSPADWTLASDFSGITIAPVEANSAAGSSMTPGVSNISGSLNLSNTSGKISLATTDGSLTFPGIFENPTIAVKNLTGEVYWTQQQGKPIVTFENIHLVNEDADVRARGTWRADDQAGPAGVADITGSIARAQASSVWKYIPLVIGQNVRDWLRDGLLEGTAQNGSFEIKGPFKAFPWSGANAGLGRFMVKADVSQAAINYVPDLGKTSGNESGAQKSARKSEQSTPAWPLLTNIDGRIAFEGFSMRIEADRARTFGVDVGPVTAQIAQLNGGKRTLLDIDGQAHGSLQKLFDYVEASPVGGFVNHAFRGTRAEGDAALSLSLDIPLLNAPATRVAGDITMAGNRVEMPHPVPPLAEVTGTVHFTEKGAFAQNVLAKPFAKEDATVNVVTSSDGTISITASGSIDIADAGYFADVPVVKRILGYASGTTPFVATTTISRKTGVTVTAQSSLNGVELKLPAPLNKPANTNWPLRFSATPVTINKQHGLMLSVAAANHFDVLLQLPSGASSTLPVRGSIGIGAKDGLPAEGFSLDIRAASLSMPDWSEPLRAIIDAATGTSGPEEEAAAQRAEHLAAALTRVQVDLGKAVFSDSSLSGLKADYRRSGADWNLSVDSDLASGTVSYKDAGDGLIVLDMPRLSVSQNAASTLREFIEGPRKKNENKTADKTAAAPGAAKPRHLPRISAKIGSLDYDGMHLGAAALETSVSRQGAREGLLIDKATLKSASGNLTASGSWMRSLTESEADRTALDVNWSISNVGGLLSEIGFPGVIEAANGTASAKLAFEGAPWSPQMDTLEGTLEVDLSKGSFVEVDTGPGGALLSLLSFQSLLKRLTLDFSDLMQKGFSFDRFTGTGTLVKGVSTTDNTKIVGAQGTILISGSIDMASRRLNTRAVVLPDINAGNASLALAFVNPAVGIGTFLAQLLLRDPISRIFKVEYDITGPFENPVITKVGDSQSKTLVTEPAQ